MREWLTGQGVILYVFAGCMAVGLVSAWIANHGYKRLIKETEVMGNTQNRLLKYIKLKFGSYYKLNMKPQDTRALARHYLYKYKIGFMSAASWVKLSKLALGAVGIAAVTDALWMLQNGKSAGELVMMGMTALLAAAVLILQNRLYDFEDKRAMLEWHLMDYLENFLKNKIESGRNLSQMAADSAALNSEPAAVHNAASGNGTGYRSVTETEETMGSYRKEHRDDYREVPGGEAAMDENISYDTEPRSDRNKPTKGTDEAAAARIPSGYMRAEDNNPYAKAVGRSSRMKPQKLSGEDEVDAKIVEDILKEFLT